MRDIWERLRSGPSRWYWVAHGLRHGDLHHLCSLADAFGDAHGRATPIKLIVGSRAQMQLAELFQGMFAEVVLEVGLSTRRAPWRAFMAEAKLDGFAPDGPLLLHPHLSGEPEIASPEFIRTNGIMGANWIQLYRQLLHLPPDAMPAPPPLVEGLASQAEIYCRVNGVVAHRSVILFPYAQSIRVGGASHFAQLAQDLQRSGLDVFTSVAGDEQPIAGTRPLGIPFNLLPDVAEQAGWVVAVRSGICDILASARCRKTFIYPHLREIASWSVAALGLARDADEFAFDFGWRGEADFSAAVRSGSHVSLATICPPRLSSAIGDRGGAGRSASATALLAQDAAPRPVEHDPETPLIMTDVPGRSHPRLGRRVDTVVAGWTAPCPEGTRFYASRDAFLTDFWEEVLVQDLLAGRYAAARGWHTLVALRAGSLPALLPEGSADTVLPVEIVGPDRWIALADLFDTEGGGAHNAGIRPLSAEGIQFVSGWSVLEPWGVWSDGYEARLKIVLGDVPAKSARLLLDCRFATSPAFPAIAFDAIVNGRLVGSYVRRIEAFEPSIEIPLDVAAAEGSTTIHLCLVFRELMTPIRQGTATDHRLLGLGVAKARIALG